MRIPSTIVSLLVAASMPLVASAAIALPSASSSLRETAAAPIQVVKHRRAHHRAAPEVQENNDSHGGYNDSSGPYSHNGGVGVDDWSQWSPSHHPGWPCISNGSDASETSAYPAWEMKPYCK
jgi:hypothetical protein